MGALGLKALAVRMDDVAKALEATILRVVFLACRVIRLRGWDRKGGPTIGMMRDWRSTARREDTQDFEDILSR